MTQRLAAIIAQLRSLPTEQQDAIANLITDDLADLRLLEERREELEQVASRQDARPELLALDSPRWAELSGAYGPAAKIPELLQALEEGRVWQNKHHHEQEPWFSLWSALCHQGDAFTASYAAVPHVIRIAQQQSLPLDYQFLALPAAIEVARLTGHGPAMPPELQHAYQAAFIEAHTLIFNLAREPWDAELASSITAILAVSKGHIALAQMILEIDDPQEAVMWWATER